MFRIDVRMDLKRFERELDDLARRQLPFAVARALTWTARDARDEVRKQVARRFVTRSKWVERGIVFRSATKRMPVAVVGSRDWFMADHEDGATRWPFKGRHRAAPLAVRKNARQKITKAKRPKALLAKGGRRKFFVQRLKTGRAKGQFAVLRRAGRDRYPLQVLYLLEAQTKIRPKFGFRKTVERTVARRLRKNFGKSLAQALATAR